MRTIAATFGTIGEAEQARRRLETIGIPAERINLREVAGAGGDGAGATLISVKVAPDQVAAATAIIEGDNQPPAAMRFGGKEDADRARIERGEARPVAIDNRTADGAPERVVADTDADQAWWQRFYRLALLAILLAFVIGAALGMTAAG